MAGWNVHSGELLDAVVLEDEIRSLYNYFFSDKCRKTTTYKFGFLKSILDNLFSVKPTKRGLELIFCQIFDKFTENYWNLILKYHLVQARPNTRTKYSGLENILLDAATRYDISHYMEYSSLNEVIRNDILQQVIETCQKNVVRAVYNDFEGKFYGFSKVEGRIWLNLPFYAFLQKYKLDIEQRNYYAWARLLEKYNEADVSIKLLSKLEDATPKRHNLALYRRILQNEFGADRCFYCGRKLTAKAQVDHVIPWQMVREDKLWNFVLACPACNASKNNRLPQKPVIQIVIERNDIIRTYGSSLNYVAEDFQNYTDTMMEDLWHYAKNGGFKEWENMPL